MSDWLSPVLSLAGSVVNGISDALGMQGSAHYQRVNMREAARLQHEENQYWADYNTPANQMQRLKDAGLNPNLVYGTGANAQFQGTVSPSGGMPRGRGGYGTDFITFSNMLEQNKNIKAQNQNLLKQNEKLVAETEETKERKRGLELDNLRKTLTNPYAAKLAWDEHLNNVSEREKNQSLAMLYDSQRQLNQMEFNGKNEFVHEIYENIKEKGFLEVELLRIEKDYKPGILASELHVNEAKARELIAQVAVASALAKQYEASTDKTIKESLGQDIDNYIKSLKASLMEIENDVNSSFVKIFIEKYIKPITDVVSSMAGATANIARGFAH